MEEKGRDQRSLVASGAMVKEAKAHGRYLHIAPTKIQDLLSLIRGKSVAEAENVLSFSGRKGGKIALKVLRSAEANAGAGFEKSGWVITDARANKGPIYRKSVRPRGRGSRDILLSPSTHITIIISEGSKVSKSNKGSEVTGVTEVTKVTTSEGGQHGS